MVKHKRQKKEDLPLFKIIEQRKDHYLKLFGEALDTVYRSGNLEYIEKVEGVIIKLTDRVRSGSLEKEVKRSIRDIVSDVIDERPILDYQGYREARDSGMTNEEIKGKYRIINPRQLSGFGGQYAKKIRNKSQNKSFNCGESSFPKVQPSESSDTS